MIVETDISNEGDGGILKQKLFDYLEIWSGLHLNYLTIKKLSIFYAFKSFMMIFVTKSFF